MGRIAPQTTFKWNDRSAITPLIAADTGAPLILIAASTDKGGEDLVKISGSDFYKRYVTDQKLMYQRHGQPLLEAAALIDAGAELLFKRIVADDATMANAIVSVEVTKTVPAEEGGSEGTPTEKLTLKLKVDTIENVKTLNDIKTQATSLKSVDNENVKTFPLFVVADTGRGVSNKKFRIIPDYATYRELDFMRYNIQIIEGTKTMENIYFSLDQNVQYAGGNYGLDSVIKNTSQQIQTYTFEDNLDEFIEFVSGILEVTNEELYKTDILNGSSKSGTKNSLIKIDDDSINLSSSLGISLVSGTNGSFGNTNPTSLDEYANNLVDLFNGEATKDIFNLDKYQIDAVFDANYPDKVKRAIETLAEYRKDFMYFRDLGFVYTYEQIKAKTAEATPSIFSATYHNSYDIIDPYSKKQIPVTVTYSLAKLFVNHFITRKAFPFEGIKYGIILDDAIEGTVNYTPEILPNVNQRQELVDINVNYASYFGTQFVMETECTSQLKNTQLSWINNVLAIQEIVKMLRLYCPRSRYTFIDEDGNGNSSAFTNYKQDVQDRLNEYKTNFKELRFEYTYDETQVQNKQFYAQIYFTFKNFIESEYFDLFAINANSEE